MNERRVTINISTELYERIQSLRGRRMTTERKGLSVTDIVITLLDAGLPVEEDKARRAAGAS